MKQTFYYLHKHSRRPDLRQSTAPRGAVCVSGRFGQGTAQSARAGSSGLERRLAGHYSSAVRASCARGRLRPLVVLLICLALGALAGCTSAPRPGASLAPEYYNVGNAWLELGQNAKAADAYRAALRLDPGMTKAEYNLAIALGRLGQAGESVALLEELAARDPTNVTVLMALAWAYHADGKDGEALARWEQVSSIAPENRDARYNAALVLWAEGRRPEAVASFQSLLAISPDDPDTLYNLGAISLELDNVPAAIDYLGRLVETRPTDTGGLLLLADGYERQTAFARALDLYGKVVAADASSAAGWFGKARLELTVVEDPDTGLADLRHALDLGFKDEPALQALLGTQGLLDRAEVEAELKGRSLLPEQAAAPAGTATEPGAPAGAGSAPPPSDEAPAAPATR